MSKQPDTIIHKVPDSSKPHLDALVSARRAFEELRQSILDEANKRLEDAVQVGDLLAEDEWKKLMASMGLNADYGDPQWFMNTFFYEQTGDAYVVYCPGATERPKILSEAPFLAGVRAWREPTEIN